MSRVGKKPILIPDSVEVKINGNVIIVKGPKGELQKEMRPEIRVKIKRKEILVTPHKIIKQTKAYWGLTRAILFNMIKGVTEGYEKKLQIEGIGYKAKVEGEKLILKLGFSHPVEVKKPEGIQFLVDKNIISISGSDRELVGLMASKIRRISPPEPYKGKGIRYVGEIVRRKAGKKVVATAT